MRKEEPLGDSGIGTNGRISGAHSTSSKTNGSQGDQAPESPPNRNPTPSYNNPAIIRGCSSCETSAKIESLIKHNVTNYRFVLNKYLISKSGTLTNF
ncbi:hypothetical protein RB195_007470 [Necator americanus]|uniref:Uncharacterized protein n=1 Tax=Necator americanus TaxID=51031 RepID=A0ABR1C169_NECAM